MRTTILFALPAKDMGGTERVVLNLLRNIDTKRFEIHLTTLAAAGITCGDIPAYVEVHEFGVGRARWAMLPIAKLCWKLKPDIVFSMSAHLNSVIIASRTLMGRDIRIFVREGADITSMEVMPSWLKRRIYKHAYRRADLVICQSEFMKQELVSKFGLSPSKVVRIYNPVDTAAITALADAEPSPYREVGPNLVSIGRLSREKGFDVLLKALHLIRKEFPTASTTILGKGPDLPELKAAQKRFGLDSAVRFLGWRRNPFPFLKHADMLVLASRSEAMPNVVLEAIALGTPAVTTNCTPALSELTSWTERVRIARDRTPEALAEEMISALSSDMTKRARSIESQFESQFGVPTVIEQYENAFLETLHSYPTRAVGVSA